METKNYRLVLNVRVDPRDGLPVEKGCRQGMVLATLLAGAEVEVTDIGPALPHGERELGDGLHHLLRQIGSAMEAIDANGEPRDGRRWKGEHHQRRGRLEGLADAYAVFTGKPRLTAERLGEEVWKNRERMPWETT